MYFGLSISLLAKERVGTSGAVDRPLSHLKARIIEGLLYSQLVASTSIGVLPDPDSQFDR